MNRCRVPGATFSELGSAEIGVQSYSRPPARGTQHGKKA